MSRRQQRDRIEQALTDLTWPKLSAIALDAGGQTARRTLAGLLCDTFASELARGRDAEETIARVRAALRGLPADGTVPVRAVLDALYGEEQAR
ncbi:hypothetical protein BX265_6154 [Streptomyces sp. TLI_235]|nr:hypothetical protein [Streptomyces sp. TLI_235]PBC71544.1 hypothetical protein BX265_6154 [Streptomyces sp. TLI_235]